MTFSFYGTSASVLVAATAVLGILVGAEVPLLMTLLASGRGGVDAQSTGKVLANLNAADYAGALAGGLVWPFVLLPLAGQIRGAALTGMVNLVAAAIVAAFLLRPQMSRAARRGATAALLAAAAPLGVLLAGSADIEVTARQRLYADPVVAADQSDYQQIVVTERDGDVRLYLDGDLQFSSLDEHRYTETLVHPALPARPSGARDSRRRVPLASRPAGAGIRRGHRGPARSGHPGLGPAVLHRVLRPGGRGAEPPVVSWRCSPAARTPRRRPTGEPRRRWSRPGWASRPTTCTCPASATGDSYWHRPAGYRPSCGCPPTPRPSGSSTARCSGPPRCSPGPQPAATGPVDPRPPTDRAGHAAGLRRVESWAGRDGSVGAGGQHRPAP